MSWKLVAVVFLSAFAGTMAAGAAEADLAALAGALAAPQVGAPITVEGSLEVGRGTIVPAPDTPVHVLTAEGIPCGLWVNGPAKFSYRVEDRFSQPVARRNLKSASRLDFGKRDGALVVTAPLEEAVVWGWDIPTVEATETASTETPGFSRWARERLERSLDSNPVRDMLLAHFNGQTDYRHALLRSGKGDLVLDIDGRPHVRTEWLMRLDPLRADAGDYAGRLNRLELAAQPMDRNWWDPVPRPFAITEVETDVAVKKPPRARVKSRVRIESHADGLRLIALGVPAHAMGGHGDLRPVALHRVTVGGEAVPSVRLGSILLVAVGHELDRGAAVTVETEIEGAFAVRPGKDNYWTMGGGELFPFPGDNGLLAARFEVSAEVGSPYVPFASGSIGSRDSAEGKERLVSRLDGPMMTAALVAGKYRTVKAERGGYKVSVSSYAHPKKDEAERLANNFFAAKECYERWFEVPYPFEELDIVEINDWGFGVAPPGVIYITRELFSTAAKARAISNRGGTEGFLAAVTSRGANERFAHEVAHGYFPHVARPEGNEESWLSESFAEYASAVCIRDTSPDSREGKWRFERRLAEWKAQTRGLGDGASIYLAEHLAGENDKDYMTRNRLLYGKGPVVLHAIRQELGRLGKDPGDEDRLFLTFMRAVVQNFPYKQVGTRHLVGILGQMTGTDWQPFFERYVYGTETPKLN